MLSKDEITKIKLACESGSCINCPLFLNNCTAILPGTTLHILERLETAETILRDVLASGNVKSCEKEIEGFLREGNKC